ncbi:MAG: methyltransferase domain-containing protein, partial [Pseudomonadales bacterium]|nr:methyltransferase domain-containing protein [Pseudomonadales bacterium]
MPDDPASKWNEAWRDRTEPGEVARVLTDYQHLLPARGRCLDVACGLGGNSLWLAKQGLEVDAWDISEVAIEKLNRFAEQQGLSIKTRVVDATKTVIPMNTYDCIFVGHFLE